MGGGRTIDRKATKYYLIIRECAGVILEAMHNQTEPELKMFNSAIICKAYKLLLFEQLICRRSGYRLTENGNKHINKVGFSVYNKKGIDL